MRVKRISSILLMILAFSFAYLAIGTSATPTISQPEYKPMDVGPKLRDSDYQIDVMNTLEGPLADTIPPEEAEGAEIIPPLDWKLWFVYDDYYAYVALEWYYLAAESEYTQIWIQEDLSYPPGDPKECVITLGQVEYLLDEFDNNIYPTDTAYFGVPDFHDGSGSPLSPTYFYDEAGRTVILVSNVRDTMYYEPDYPYFIIGFYWGLYEYYFDRNIITIDADFWEAYVGPPGHQYEATVSHELQHLIHADYNPGDATFMNEGCSTFSEWLCGYPVPWGDINSYLATPDNSLTVWGDQGGINILADYGVAFLWAMYLNDRFGPDFLGDFVQAGIPGITGLEAAMFPYTFNVIYHDWRIANLIHSNHPGHGRYNYKSIDLSEANPIELNTVSEIPSMMYGSDFGTTITMLGYDTEISKNAPYGSDYVQIIDLDEFRGNKLFIFNGDESGYATWQTVAENRWWSMGANLYNALLVGEAYVDPTDPTLELTTYYEIEANWDFGFVQVSTDDGATWTSLENEYTTYDYLTNVQPIIDNLPGLTGYSVDWITMTFDLAAYAGETVLIGFRYMTDQYTTWRGWYVEDASVSGSLLDLTPIADPIPVDWQVTLVYYKDTWKGLRPYKVKDLRLFECAEFGFRFLGNAPDEVIAVISPINAGLGLTDYWFAIVGFRCRHH